MACGKEPRITVDQVLTMVARVEHRVEIPSRTAKRELEQDDRLVLVAKCLVNRRKAPANVELLGREGKVLDANTRTHLELARPRFNEDDRAGDEDQRRAESL